MIHKGLMFTSTALGALLLAACGSETSGEFTTEDGESGEYTIDTRTGETVASIETDEGTATLRSGADVPVDLPAGFTVYPGAKLVSNTVVNHGDGNGTMLQMETDDSIKDVTAFYRKQAEAAGIEIQMELTVNGHEMIGGENGEGLVFSANASEGDEGQTQAQLMVGSKLGQ